MHPQDSEPRARSATASVLNMFRAVQIEHQGEYTTHRLCLLQDYITSRFTASRLTALLFVTPLPSIAIVLLIELAPLNSPSAGSQRNVVFWGRLALVNLIQGVCYVSVSHAGVPSLKLTHPQVACAAICAATASVGTLYAIASEVGFPVPFATAISSVPWFISTWMVIGVFSFRRIFADPVATLSLKEWLNVSSLLASQFFIYPLFNYAFCLAPPLGQTALSMVLGAIKIFYRYAVGKAVKQQINDRAEIVTFNAEVSHAMFVAFSMQNATSIMTVVALLVIDVLHASSVLYDVHIMVQRLEVLDSTIRVNEKELTRDLSIIDRTVILMSRQLTSQGPSMISPSAHKFSESVKVKRTRWVRQFVQRSISNITKVHVAKALATPLTKAKRPSNMCAVQPSSPNCTALVKNDFLCQTTQRAAEAEYISTSLQLLHLTEFTMLGELVEFVVPIVYTSYVAVMVHLPNRVFCPQLATTTVDNVDSIALRMLSYGLLELVSLILIDWILRSRLRFSPTAQLAMVLETRWGRVQGGFIALVLYTIQGFLQHFGTDFSFQFAWLHGNSADGSSDGK